MMHDGAVMQDDEEYMLDANFEEEMFASNDEAAEKRKNLEGISPAVGFPFAMHM